METKFKWWGTLSSLRHNDEHDTAVSVTWAACKSFRYHKITFTEDFKESSNILTEGLMGDHPLDRAVPD